MSPILRFIASGLEFLSAMVVAVNAGKQMGQAWDDMQDEQSNPHPDVPDDIVDIRECEDWYAGEGK